MAHDQHTEMDEKYENTHRQLTFLVNAHLPVLLAKVAKVVASRDAEQKLEMRQESQRRSCKSCSIGER